VPYRVISVNPTWVAFSPTFLWMTTLHLGTARKQWRSRARQTKGHLRLHCAWCVYRHVLHILYGLVPSSLTPRPDLLPCVLYLSVKREGRWWESS
jgi:hypothetical protein